MHFLGENETPYFCIRLTSTVLDFPILYKLMLVRGVSTVNSALVTIVSDENIESISS